MEVVIRPNVGEASCLAARLIAATIRKKPDAVLGLATGSTPLALYRELIRMHREDGLDFSHVTTFNLDEYLGLAPDHPASYNAFMHENLFDHINIQESRIHIPDGLTQDVVGHCAVYESDIMNAGGLDLQVLGIGGDGHIGFNEPTSSLASRTRIKTLTEETVRDNARFFSSADEVPKHVITMGIGTIMEARGCIMLAFGESKAQAVADAVEGPVTSMVPATALQFHRNAKAFLDDPAADRLKLADYYRWVFDNKPSWQQF